MDTPQPIEFDPATVAAIAEAEAISDAAFRSIMASLAIPLAYRRETSGTYGESKLHQLRVIWRDRPVLAQLSADAD